MIRLLNFLKIEQGVLSSYRSDDNKLVVEIKFEPVELPEEDSLAQFLVSLGFLPSVNRIGTEEYENLLSNDKLILDITSKGEETVYLNKIVVELELERDDDS